MCAHRCTCEVGRSVHNLCILLESGDCVAITNQLPIWQRQTDEPARAFARFEIYRLLGPKRSIDQAYRLIAEREQLPGRQPSGAFMRQTRKWRWRQRAQAWDAAERERLRGLEEERRFDAREYRLGMIEALMAAIFEGLQGAQLAAMNPEELRNRLPTLRLFFKDLLAAQRAELAPRESKEAGVEIPPFTADELIEAHAELARQGLLCNTAPGDGPAQAALGELHADPVQGVPAFITLRNVLAAYYPDVESARRIAEQAGLSLDRIRFSALAVNNWHAVLAEAQKQDQMQALIEVVKTEYGASKDLRHAIAQLDLTQ